MAGNPIRDVYIAIDEAIGEILKQVDDQTVVIILASHRMGYSYGAQFLLPDILIRLKAAQALFLEGQSPDVRSRIDTVLTWGWKHTPALLKQKLNPIANRLRGKIHLPRSIAGLDLTKSRCFPLDNGLTVGGIRVNLAGREPNGVTRPGAEMDALCDYLTRELQKITYLDTGKPAIKGVKRTAELYQGDRLDHLPDILVEWNDEKPLATAGVGNAKGERVRLCSERIGTVEGVNTYCRTGDHRPEGLFIAIGPGIERGYLKDTVSIMDFAPTFARLLGVPLRHADGRPIAEIVEPNTASP
jgi:predicted AlkP superfamily phosphohydrolase/phosphomutase